MRTSVCGAGVESTATGSFAGVVCGIPAGGGGGRLWGLATLLRAVDRSDDPTYAGNQLPRVPVAEAIFIRRRSDLALDRTSLLSKPSFFEIS